MTPGGKWRVDLGSETTAMEFLKLQLECYLEVWKFCTIILRGKMENLNKKQKKMQNKLFLKNSFQKSE